MRDAFVNCSDKQVFPPDTYKCLAVVKNDNDSLLRVGGRISATYLLREAQDLILAWPITRGISMFSADPVRDFRQVVDFVAADYDKRYCHT